MIWEPDLSPLPGFVDRLCPEAEFLPEQLRSDSFLPHVERWRRQAGELPGDLIQRFTPGFGIPWMEAIAGCPVVARRGSLSAEPSLADYANRPAVRFDRDNPWFRKLIECTRAMVELSDGRFPVAVPPLHGPLDILAAMRTPEQMCRDLSECPDDAFTLLGELTDLWIKVGRAVLDVIPPFHGGHSGKTGIWAPGPAITLQNDVSKRVSAEAYWKHVLPWDREIVANFPYTEFHMHAAQHHQVDNILELDQLTAIEFTLEHTIGGPPLQEMLPVARRILQSKPLLLATLDLESADRCMRELPATGLCIMLAVGRPRDPAGVLPLAGSTLPLRVCLLHLQLLAIFARRLPDRLLKGVAQRFDVIEAGHFGDLVERIVGAGQEFLDASELHPCDLGPGRTSEGRGEAAFQRAARKLHVAAHVAHLNALAGVMPDEAHGGGGRAIGHGRHVGRFAGDHAQGLDERDFGPAAARRRISRCNKAAIS